MKGKLLFWGACAFFGSVGTVFAMSALSQPGRTQKLEVIPQTPSQQDSAPTQTQTQNSIVVSPTPTQQPSPIASSGVVSYQQNTNLDSEVDGMRIRTVPSNSSTETSVGAVDNGSTVFVGSTTKIVDSTGCQGQGGWAWVTIPQQTTVYPSDENSNGKTERQGYIASCGLR
jgi:hypothetical protein